MTHKCHKCFSTKPLTDFRVDRSNKKGVSNWCKECFRVYELTNDKKTLKELQKWKETQPCTDCGNFFPYYVLEFDHTEGNQGIKKSPPHARARKLSTLLRIIEEEKIEIVCANCHKIRTHERRVALAS